MPERIFVVGHAAVTCLGQTSTRHGEPWSKADQGSGATLRWPVRNSSKIWGGWSTDFWPGSADEDPAIAKLSARFVHLSMAAARAAWSDASLDRLEGQFDPHRAAVVVGFGLRRPRLARGRTGPNDQTPEPGGEPLSCPGDDYQSGGRADCSAPAVVRPSAAPANACASGGHAIALGAMFLRAGEADLALCGGAESAFTPPVVNGFATMKALLGRKPGDRSEQIPAKRVVRSASIGRDSFSPRGPVPWSWPPRRP